MKRLFLGLLIIMLSIPLFTHADPHHVDTNKIDYFLIDYGKEVVPIATSSTFNAAYRVIDIHELENQGERFWLITFELELTNLTKKPLKNLTINAKFRRNLQLALVNSQWYNEPITLNADNGKDLSHCITYSWTAMLDLDTVSFLPLSLDDFYNAIIEVKWKNGNENLYITSEESLRNYPWEEISPLASPLNSEIVTQINETAMKRIR